MPARPDTVREEVVVHGNFRGRLRSGERVGRAETGDRRRSAGAVGFGGEGRDDRGEAGQGFAVGRLRTRCDPGPGGPARVRGACSVAPSGSGPVFRGARSVAAELPAPAPSTPDVRGHREARHQGAALQVPAMEPGRSVRRVPREARVRSVGSAPMQERRLGSARVAVRWRQTRKRPSRSWRPGTARPHRRLRPVGRCARVPGTGRGRWPAASGAACGSPARTAPGCPPGCRAPGRARSRR